MTKHRNDLRAPSAAEQLAAMCDCPACRVGNDARCWAGAASEPGEECTVCGGPCTAGPSVLVLVNGVRVAESIR